MQNPHAVLRATVARCVQESGAIEEIPTLQIAAERYLDALASGRPADDEERDIERAMRVLRETVTSDRRGGSR